jgi:predicted DNA-binding protein
MKNLSKVVGVRVTENLYLKLRKISNARGEDTSDFVRRAILKELASLNFLSAEQKKALGIKKETQK